MTKIKFPSVADVARALISAKRWIERGEWVDVRLQVWSDGSWTIHTGDASYDQDHRGFWGASSMTTRTNARELAKELISEAQGHQAQCGDGEDS